VTIQNKKSTYRGVYYLQAKSDIPLPEVLKILNLLGKKEQVQFSLQGHTIIIQ
jgi:transmembrane sensor